MSGVSQAYLNINFTCEWQGPNREGGLVTNLVRLNFEGAKAKFSVKIPNNSSQTHPQQLPFTCRRLDNVVTQPHALTVTIEKMRSLKIFACVDETTPPKTRTERPIPLHLPENLEADQTYHLILTSNDFNFSAALIKLDVEALKKAQENLYNVLYPKLYNLMLASIFEYSVGCPDDSRPEAKGAGVTGIREEIKQINPDVILDTMKEINHLSDPAEIEKRSFGLVGRKRIANIFSTNLRNLLKGPGSSEANEYIDEISEKYAQKIIYSS